MNNDYELHFEPVFNPNSYVRFRDCSQRDSPERIIKLNLQDDDFKFRLIPEFPSVIADLIDLAVAIHITDSLCTQPLGKPRHRIHVVLPIRQPENCNTNSWKDKLEELLNWGTGSQWTFDFRPREGKERSIVKERLLMPIVPSESEIALWSGGLDSLAGLYTRLKKQPEHKFVLFGTGGNHNVYARQKCLAKQIDLLFPDRGFPCLVPIRLRETDSLSRNKIPRARGIVFTLLGLACTYLMGQRILYVYENGIGAINLPYRASIGLDHTRSVHPLTLLRVSDLVSDLLGEKCQIRNPFLFETKAQMCQALVKDGRNDITALTQSCDSQHRKPDQPKQCGYCSSCLLRRQALAAAGIEDRTRYVVTHGKPPIEDPSLYFRNMREQVRTLQHLLAVSEQPSRQWESLTGEFPELDDIVDNGHERENLSPREMRDRLIQLYQTHITEWSAVESRLAVNLLDRQRRAFSDRQPSDSRPLTVQNHYGERLW